MGKQFMGFTFAISATITLLLISCTAGITLEEELTLTSGQKEILDKFKEEVSTLVPHEYMKQEIYLIKWLRARNFDVDASKAMLLNNLEWRKDNNVDGILEDDFGHFLTEFPFWYDGKDNSGRPVLSADISVWDPRTPIIAGNVEKLFRYMLRATEFASKTIRDDQLNGKNVTQCTLIANLDGFNLIQHGCVRCFPLYIRYLLAFQSYYPGLVHKLFIVNTPAAFDVLLRVVWPVLTPDVREFLNIYGTNRKRWQIEVLKEVPADQIRSQFGGTMPSE